MNASTPISYQPSLTQGQIDDLRLAASKMKNVAKRAFQAEMALKYCHGNARLAESLFGWARSAVEVGLAEKRTGIVCFGSQSAYSGQKRWEEQYPDVANALFQLAEEHGQQDPTFRTTIAFTRLTAKRALEELRAQGFSEDQLPSASAMAVILNRSGFRLRRIVKAKPQKKIKETDAIFENIEKKDRLENIQGSVKRLSMDCKATVCIGDFSRGGVTRGDNKACDHDMGCKEKYTPCGIVDEDTGQLYITFGSSYKTSDFIVDTLEAWWDRSTDQEKQEIDLVQIKIDNGPESSGIRTQFLNRMVQFSGQIGKRIQLLYFPPYHSKYNPIERCWGIMELHWNGAKLIDAGTMLEWAKSMTWKGLSPVVEISRKIYKKGISLSKSAMKKVERWLERDEILSKWDIMINPVDLA